MMSKGYTFLSDLASQIKIAPGSIVSKTVLKETGINVTLFGMDAGEGLTEHSTSQHAILYFVSGEIELTLGADTFSAQPCSWLHMEPNLPHSLKALSPAVFALILLKNQ